MLNTIKYHKRHHHKVLDKGLYTFLNPYSYLIARKNISYFSRFDCIFFDGVVLKMLMSMFRIARSERKSFDMTSIAFTVFNECVRDKKTIYFIGSKYEEISDAVLVFCQAFPGLHVAGFRDGYFKSIEGYQKAIKEVVDLDPDIIVAGLGTPLQEKFLLDTRDAGWLGTGFTCGGFFHQTAKKGIHYYPEWVDKLNLRWLYRMYDEPRLYRRYLIQYPLFLMVFIYDLALYLIETKVVKTKSII